MVKTDPPFAGRVLWHPIEAGTSINRWADQLEILRKQ